MDHGVSGMWGMGYEYYYFRVRLLMFDARTRVQVEKTDIDIHNGMIV
jgi:hypothetical protein